MNKLEFDLLELADRVLVDSPARGWHKIIGINDNGVLLDNGAAEYQADEIIDWKLKDEDPGTMSQAEAEKCAAAIWDDGLALKADKSRKEWIAAYVEALREGGFINNN